MIGYVDMCMCIIACLEAMCDNMCRDVYNSMRRGCVIACINVV